MSPIYICLHLLQYGLSQPPPPREGGVDNIRRRVTSEADYTSASGTPCGGIPPAS